MSQKEEQILPLFLQVDNSVESLKPNESSYLKGVGFDINGSPSEEAGTTNGTGLGQNMLTLSPTRSNQILPSLPSQSLPLGYNKNHGSFESIETNEFYYANFNGNGDHGIYVKNCDTGEWNMVIVDKNLPFTEDQSSFLSEHRWSMRILYNVNKNIIAKFLIYTNAAGWQGWINVIASISTNGFDASSFPYFSLLQPHFDRRELIEWPTRPPMYNPTLVPIPNTPALSASINRVIDQAIQICFHFNYTDGRRTQNSPYSLPLIIKSEDFLNNPDVLPKTALLTMYAGSCMVESIDILIRVTAKKQIGLPSTVTWGDWQKYDRIYKYSNSDQNPSDILSTKYWLRTNPWSKYNYDPIQNTIQYVFDNSKLSTPIDQVDANRIQNDIPIRSVALTNMNDEVALGDNLYGYNNFPFSTINNVSVEVETKSNVICPVTSRKVRLYAYVGKASDNFFYYSQVGYYVGQDTQARWGSLSEQGGSLAAFSVAQSKQFGLDFADHNAFVCYAKGTPFFVVGKWYQVNTDNSYLPIPSPILDFSNNDVLAYVANVFLQGGYFMCVFDFEVPAGRYDFCIGRHNVNLSDDFRSVSTYVYGIANSRVKTLTGVLNMIHPNAIQTYSKEMEIDCTNGDVDVWGNGLDMFYIYCPSPTFQSNNKFRFIEGYLKESANGLLPVELFPYTLNVGPDDWGKLTDKNGFYWAYTKRANSNIANIEVSAKVNCNYPFNFEIPTSGGGIGWMVNGVAFLSDHTGGVLGPCNRVVISGKITDPTGTIPYSNISVSIADGGSVATNTDGTFNLIVHNGQNTLRVNNIYVNAAGDFLITLPNCGAIPLFNFNEALAPCFNCQLRNYPVLINLQIIIQGGTQESIKENGSYQTSIHAADLAGRVTFENVVSTLTVPSFNQRGNLLATFLRMLINGPLKFERDLAWFSISVSNQISVLRYFQWVGDNIAYIDNAGNVVEDPATAVFASITITSFYNYALANNFSILASYQFSANDRIRFLDDGNNNLLGDSVDLSVLGTNYNQAAMAVNIIPQTNNNPTINNIVNATVNTSVNTGGSSPTSTTSLANQAQAVNVTLFVKYDSRLNALSKNTGFWIEIYTPSQQSKDLQYNELQWYPIIKGEPAIFQNIVNGQPVFLFPDQIDIPFWDTYLFFRSISIPGVGNKFLDHPFESPNISDFFGANVNSGGRILERNEDAKQEWDVGDIIKSDSFSGRGIINGLGTFRSSNRHRFTQYPYGPINMMVTQRSIIFVLCQNDWFTVTFDFHFTYPNAQGVMVVNLDNNISTPSQKIGSNFGLQPEDTGSVVVYESEISWYDRNNQAWIICDYRTAKDISLFNPNEGVVGGMSSYLNSKSRAISEWDKTAENSSKFDVIGGVDLERGNLYLTFRPRRKNSNDPSSYGSQRRNIDLLHQETLVFNTITKRFTRFENFTPEAYGKMRGRSTGIQLVTFAAGIPYIHNTENNSFNSFYGIQYDPIVMGVLNQNQSINKIFANMVLDINGPGMFVDFLRTNEPNSFSYVPMNLVNKKENKYYLSLLRDMNSYPTKVPEDSFISTLIDGKRIYNLYLLFRLIGDPGNRGKYFELKSIYSLFTDSTNEKK